MTNDTGRLGLRGSGQTSKGYDGGKDERRVEILRALTLGILRIVELLWWLVVVSILVGRYYIVGVTAYYCWKWLKPLYQETARDMKVCWIILLFATLAAIALVNLPTFGLFWPTHWTWFEGRMRLTFSISLSKMLVWLRFLPLVILPIAWRAAVPRLRFRNEAEIYNASISNIVFDPALPSSVHLPSNAPITYRDRGSDVPEPPQQVIVQPTNHVLYNRSPKAKPVPMLKTDSGKLIETSRVVEMIEAQHGGTGFAEDVWRRFGWKRSQWNTAKAWLYEHGLITLPTKGKQTKLLVGIDHALDVVKGME